MLAPLSPNSYTHTHYVLTAAILIMFSNSYNTTSNEMVKQLQQIHIITDPDKHLDIKYTSGHTIIKQENFSLTRKSRLTTPTSHTHTNY